MRTKWVLLIVAGVAALTVLAACGSDDDGGGGSSSPGGLTEEQAGDRTKEIIAANECDGPAGGYSSIKVVGDKWELVASIGLSSYTWTLDPVAGTVTEASGLCKT